MMHKRGMMFGLAGGFLFFAHAMINNSHAWPLVWPALAGIMAVWSARGSSDRSYRADLSSAASAGLIAGIVFLVATAFTLGRMGLLATPGLSGLLFAAALGLLAAVIAGALVHPVAKRA